MRNLLYPSQQAEYIDRTELRELRKQNAIGEKDPKFGIEQPDIGETEETKESSETNAIVNVQVELLSVRLFLSLRRVTTCILIS